MGPRPLGMGCLLLIVAAFVLVGLGALLVLVALPAVYEGVRP